MNISLRHTRIFTFISIFSNKCHISIYNLIFFFEYKTIDSFDIWLTIIKRINKMIKQGIFVSIRKLRISLANGDGDGNCFGKYVYCIHIEGD